MRKLSSSRSHKFPNVASQIRVAFSKIVSNTRLRFPDELAITPNTSKAADNCFSASSRSKRVTSSLEKGVALSRFDGADLRRRALTIWLPALERRFIAFPRNLLEVGNMGSQARLAGTPIDVRFGSKADIGQITRSPRRRGRATQPAR